MNCEYQKSDLGKGLLQVFIEKFVSQRRCVTLGSWCSPWIL